MLAELKIQIISRSLLISGCKIIQNQTAADLRRYGSHRSASAPIITYPPANGNVFSNICSILYVCTLLLIKFLAYPQTGKLCRTPLPNQPLIFYSSSSFIRPCKPSFSNSWMDMDFLLGLANTTVLSTFST